MLEHPWLKTNELSQADFQSWLQKNIVEPTETEMLSMSDIP